MTVWFFVVIGRSLWAGWQERSNLRAALLCSIAPIASLTLFALVLTAIWLAWGVWPLPLETLTDFAIERTLPSSDGAWLAVQAENLSGGPATGTSFEVYLVRAAPKNALFSKDLVFSIECIQNLQVNWAGARTLEIGYVVGDQTATEGLLPRPPVPLFYTKQDEMRIADPVRVVETRHVVHGNLC